MAESADTMKMGQYDIARDIRKEIASGKRPPGSRIPGHRELIRRYDSSGVTVQRAMEILIEQGFVESVPRSGRFVAEHPPHTHRVGLVFPGHPEEIRNYRWTRFFTALWAAAQRINRLSEWEIVPYFDIAPNQEGELTDGYRALMGDVHSNEVGGLLFSYTPQRLTQTELMEERPVPLIRLTLGGKEWGSTVGINHHRIMEKIVARMVARNRRRLAWVTISKQDPDWLRPRLEEMNRKHGFYSPSRWIHPMNPYSPRWIRHTLSTMFQGPDGDRPDGLVILDDHLVEPVAREVEEMDVAVPEDLLIAGYWNYPLAYRADTPVARVGLDTIEQLHVALELLQKRQAGEDVEPQHPIEPIFASEFRERYGEDEEVFYEDQSLRQGNAILS